MKCSPTEGTRHGTWHYSELIKNKWRREHHEMRESSRESEKRRQATHRMPQFCRNRLQLPAYLDPEPPYCSSSRDASSQSSPTRNPPPFDLQRQGQGHYYHYVGSMQHLLQHVSRAIRVMSCHVMFETEVWFVLPGFGVRTDSVSLSIRWVQFFASSACLHRASSCGSKFVFSDE